MFRIILYLPLLGLSLVCLQCTSGSYLSGLSPDTIVYQQTASGGIIQQIGGELNAPNFVVLANGTLIVQDYIDGKRLLMSGKLKRKSFDSLLLDLHAIKNTANTYLPDIHKEHAILPMLSICFLNDTLIFRIPVLEDTTTAEGRAFTALRKIDSYRRSIKGQRYFPSTIRLYAKHQAHGDIAQTQRWPLREVTPDTLVRVPVSYYEPNTDQNSTLLSGSVAKKIQQIMPQSGIYYKFSYKDKIYFVGYRPIIP